MECISMLALRLSNDITSSLPLTLTVKYLSALLSTWYGPSYSRCKGFRTQSLWTKTRVQVIKSLLTNALL